VKPSNILLEDDLDRVKLTDFGVVKDLARQTAVTQSGELVGTLGFMAPEQIEGQPVTPATDVFAVGVVFYQLLTGKLPFGGSTPTAVMRQIVEEPHRSLSEFGSLVPPALQRIIDRCLAKAPQERFLDGSELEQALADYQSTVAGSAPDLPLAHHNRSPRTGKWMAVLVCGLAALLLLALWLLSRPTPAATIPQAGTTVPTSLVQVQPVTATAPAAPDAPGIVGSLRVDGWVDLLAGVDEGAWRNVLPRGGRWLKVPEGLRLFPAPGGGPDFAWSYPLPEGTAKIEAVLVFKMSPAGAFQVVFRDKPGIFDDVGVAVGYQWHPGLTVGDMIGRAPPYMITVPLANQDLFSDWHALRITAQAGRVVGQLDDAQPVTWEGEYVPTQILLSGDEFIDVYIREFRARFSR
jgi:hypothetical protein